MRILFVSDSVRSAVTGAGRMSVTLLRELVNQGHEVVGLDWQPNPLVESIVGHCAVLPPRLPWWRTALWHFDLLRRLRTLGVDCDWLLDPSAYPHVLGSHPRLAAFVLDLSALRPRTYRPFKRSWFRLFYRRGLTKARLLICISNHTRTDLLNTYPSLDPERCVVLHCALDPTLGPASDTSPDPSPPLKPPAKPYFLSVGTIEARKNTTGLVKAFAQARSQGLTANLILAGRPGHRSNHTISRISQPDLQDHVQILSNCSDQQIHQLYRNARALLFPSFEEGFGLPILEAMGAGIPVLTSNCSAMPEVAGDAALLVDPHETHALAQAILQLDRDEDLRSTLVARGRERLKHFDPTRQAKHLIELLTEAD